MSAGSPGARVGRVCGAGRQLCVLTLSSLVFVCLLHLQRWDILCCANSPHSRHRSRCCDAWGAGGEYEGWIRMLSMPATCFCNGSCGLLQLTNIVVWECVLTERHCIGWYVSVWRPVLTSCDA